MRSSIRRTLLPFFLAAALAPAAWAQTQFCDRVNEIPQDECEALVALFVDTGGLEWRVRDGWLRWSQPCLWFGVSCSTFEAPRHVTAIRLVDNNVNGQLPGALSLLPELRELVIQNRGSKRDHGVLTGTIPLPFIAMEHLEVVWLSDNALSGSIPQDIVDLPSLRILNLDGNEFTGRIPPGLGNVEGLQELDLSDNHLQGEILPSLGRLRGLRRLGLGDNNLSGPIPTSLTRLDSLRVLDVSDNRLDGPLPDSLDRLRSLFRFDVSNNNLSGEIPATLVDLPDLSILDLSGNRFAGSLDESTARALALIPFCSIEANSASLCVPRLDAASNQTVCGLPQSDTCTPGAGGFLEAFSVTETAAGARFEWTIRPTVRADRFELEQLDHTAPRLLHTVTVAPGERSFSYDLPALPRGAYRFRLKVIEEDGSVVFGPEIPFVRVAGEIWVEAWPNPVSSTLRLRLSSSTDRTVDLSLIDAQGRVRASAPSQTLFAGGAETVEWNVSGLAPGAYLLRVTAEGIAPFVRQVVVAR